MMKITSTTETETLTLKLEGALTGRWVEELKGCWQAASEMKKVQHIRLDLSDVTFVDDEGKAVLALLHRTGAEILATNVLTKFIVEEIAGRTPKAIE
jgi:ABC-type transporter Mla MlaB component